MLQDQNGWDHDGLREPIFFFGLGRLSRKKMKKGCKIAYDSSCLNKES